MDTLLKPARLDLDPNSPSAAKEWKHWHKTFTNFLSECGERVPDKYRTLINYVSHNVYEYIEDCADYESALEVLNQLFIKKPNEIFARHLLATRRQKSGETLVEFIQELRRLSKDCNLKSVSAEQYREELIRDSFINGLLSPLIRQRLLENSTLDLKSAFDQANALDLAQKNAEIYTMPTIPTVTAAAVSVTEQTSKAAASDDDATLAGTFTPKKCYFCGNSIHNRRNCPARNCVCDNCGKKGHYAKVCRSKASTVASIFSPSLCAIVASCPESLKQASVMISVGKKTLTALVDSGSSDSYISENMAKHLNLHIHPSTQDVSMALSSLKSHVVGHCYVDITLNEHVYPSCRLGILKELMIPKSTPVCALSAASVEEPSLFANLRPDCKPIASKSRRFSKEDQDFIQQEVNQLLSEGIIEPSNSPWRAQVVVVKDPLNRHKKRLCIDYSQTVNQYTELDAYPLPRIDDMINNLAGYKFFSTFDLKSAYHQVPIKEADQKYTAFEANGRLYHFRRIPFGVTNGVAVFQRAMDKFVDEEGLKDTFPYLDNITVAGRDQEDHDENVQKFHEAIHRRNFTLNETKSVESKSSINLLGYGIGQGVITPDPERLRPLQEFPPPEMLKPFRE